MRRYILLVAVVMISCLAQPARAQYGYGFGQGADPIAEIEAARSKAKQDRTKYAKPGGAGASATRRAPVGGGFADTYGRMDLSGHPVPGYPAVRGDLSHSRVSRGGANGTSRRPARRRTAH
jgi:hypothetical protein